MRDQRQPTKIPLGARVLDPAKVKATVQALREPEAVAGVARWTRKPPTLWDCIKVARLRRATERSAWAESRAHLDLALLYLETDGWATQRGHLDLDHPANYEPPPPTSSRDISALVHAPRPGPLAGIAQRAA